MPSRPASCSSLPLRPWMLEGKSRPLPACPLSLYLWSRGGAAPEADDRHRAVFLSTSILTSVTAGCCESPIIGSTTPEICPEDYQVRKPSESKFVSLPLPQERQLGSTGKMVATPWGESDSLRERMLRPGPGTPAEEVSENQRQRLFGAMVASVAQRGYEATRVGDLVRISGVSKRSFYDLYDDKEACFVAALEVVLASIVEASLSPDAAGNPPQGARGYLARFAETIAAQPAAARMCLIDVYAAGPRATRLLEAATGQAEALLRERLGETSEWAEMPPEVTAAAVGAILEISRNRLLRHDEKELPSAGAELLGVMLSYRPPTEPLRRPRRAQRIENPAPPPQDHAERALRAFEAIVAEQGYGETTMEAVAKRASMSRKTLYANFGETR